MRVCEKCKTIYEGGEKTPCPRCGAFPDAGKYGTMAPVVPPQTTGVPVQPPPVPVQPPPQEGPYLRCPYCNVPFMGRWGDPCPRCGKALGAPPGLPWQHRRENGLSVFEAVWKTILYVNQMPGQAFQDLRLGRGAAEPVKFLVIVALILGVIGALEGLVFQDFVAKFMGRLGRFAGRGPFAPAGGLNAVTLTVTFVMIPLGVLINLFVYAIVACLNNYFIKALGGEEQEVADTFCAIAYGSVSASVWGVIPFFGGLIAFIYGIVVKSKALATIHRTTVGRALLVMFLSFMVFVVVIGALVGGIVVLVIVLARGLK